jgi:hypothetical protein
MEHFHGVAEWWSCVHSAILGGRDDRNFRGKIVVITGVVGGQGTKVRVERLH